MLRPPELLGPWTDPTSNYRWKQPGLLTPELALLPVTQAGSRGCYAASSGNDRDRTFTG